MITADLEQAQAPGNSLQLAYLETLNWKIRKRLLSKLIIQRPLSHDVSLRYEFMGIATVQWTSHGS